MFRFDKFHVHDLMIGVYLHGRAWATILRHPGLNHPKNASGDSLRVSEFIIYFVDVVLVLILLIICFILLRKNLNTC